MNKVFTFYYNKKASFLMELERIFLFISEDETLIENDIEKLVSKKIISREDLSSDTTAVICLSRDYYELPHKTGAFRIRDQLANVFCPDWRINSVTYPSLSGIMNLQEEDIPEIYIITSNDDIYENLDYYLHLQRFGKRYRLLLKDLGPTGPDVDTSFVPIKSEIYRPEVFDLGEKTFEILHLAGYGEMKNGPVPGWVFQSANPWLTRVLDLFAVSPTISLRPSHPLTLKITKEELRLEIENPVRETAPQIGEDIRFCFLESFQARKKVAYDLTKKILEKTQDL